MSKRKLQILEQWIEVVIKDGKVATTLHPSNKELERKANRMKPAPDFVYRRLNFPAGIPKDYHWAAKDEFARHHGGTALQRLKFKIWLQVKSREEKRGDGHVGPTGAAKVGRPRERGHCPCPVCNRD